MKTIKLKNNNTTVIIDTIKPKLNDCNSLNSKTDFDLDYIKENTDLDINEINFSDFGDIYKILYKDMINNIIKIEENTLNDINKLNKNFIPKEITKELLKNIDKYFNKDNSYFELLNEKMPNYFKQPEEEDDDDDDEDKEGKIAYKEAIKLILCHQVKKEICDRFNKNISTFNIVCKPIEIDTNELPNENSSELKHHKQCHQEINSLLNELYVFSTTLKNYKGNFLFSLFFNEKQITDIKKQIGTFEAATTYENLTSNEEKIPQIINSIKEKEKDIEILKELIKNEKTQEIIKSIDKINTSIEEAKKEKSPTTALLLCLTKEIDISNKKTPTIDVIKQNFDDLEMIINNSSSKVKEFYLKKIKDEDCDPRKDIKEFNSNEEVKKRIKSPNKDAEDLRDSLMIESLVTEIPNKTKKINLLLKISAAEISAAENNLKEAEQSFNKNYKSIKMNIENLQIFLEKIAKNWILGWLFSPLKKNIDVILLYIKETSQNLQTLDKSFKNSESVNNVNKSDESNKTNENESYILSRINTNNNKPTSISKTIERYTDTNITQKTITIKSLDILKKDFDELKDIDKQEGFDGEKKLIKIIQTTREILKYTPNYIFNKDIKSMALSLIEDGIKKFINSIQTKTDKEKAYSNTLQKINEIIEEFSREISNDKLNSTEKTQLNNIKKSINEMKKKYEKEIGSEDENKNENKEKTIKNN